MKSFFFSFQRLREEDSKKGRSPRRHNKQIINRHIISSMNLCEEMIKNFSKLSTMNSINFNVIHAYSHTQKQVAIGNLSSF